MMKSAHITNYADCLCVVAGLSEPEKRNSTYIVGRPLVRVRAPRYYGNRTQIAI